MKRSALLAILFTIQYSLFTVFNSYPQKTVKEITLDDIWTNYTFHPKSAPGILSMKDGEHYTSNNAWNINEYLYRQAKK